MEYKDMIDRIKASAKAMKDPMYIANKLQESEIFNFTKNVSINNILDKNIYVEDEMSNIENNDSVPMEDNESYNDNKSSGYYNKEQDTSSEPQGVIDSITQEMTPVRLQQAIILSEIVGKPRSKTRKRRRF